MDCAGLKISSYIKIIVDKITATTYPAGKRGIRYLVLATFVGILAMPCFGQENVRPRLDACIGHYTDGDYQKAIDSLTTVIHSLTSPEDLMEAYKYLGFSYGMLNMIDKSKETFKIALNKFRSMTIDTLEVPPNIAIIFNQAKLEKKLEALSSEKQRKQSPAPVVVYRKKNVTAPILLLTGSFLCVGASAYCLFYANDQNQKYKTLNVPDQALLDKYYSNYRNLLIAGVACAGASIVMLPISIYLFAKKEPALKTLSLGFVNGQWALQYSF